jgi:hypothetical protein
MCSFRSLLWLYLWREESDSASARCDPEGPENAQGEGVKSSASKQRNRKLILLQSGTTLLNAIFIVTYDDEEVDEASEGVGVTLDPRIFGVGLALPLVEE